jgi:hypothetical protein
VNTSDEINQVPVAENAGQPFMLIASVTVESDRSANFLKQKRGKSNPENKTAIN